MPNTVQKNSTNPLTFYSGSFPIRNPVILSRFDRRLFLPFLDLPSLVADQQP